MEEETLAFPPWLDLPEPLVELVLERLHLVDYIRFAAVCPRWRSIQRGHRFRHAPHPPPMAKQLPWLLSIRLYLDFYNPSDQKSYRLRIPNSFQNACCLASCQGWLLLLLDDINCGPMPISKRSILFNPITATQIPLPPLSPLSRIRWCRVVGAMSTTPTDPDCMVLLVLDHCAFLYRLNGHCAADWMIIQLTSVEGVFGDSVVYCGGKFYYSYNSADEVYVIDPLFEKAASRLVMRYPYEASRDANRVFLHESGGELFSVQTLYASYAINGLQINGFRVFKADLSRQEWVRVETLGDHALFHHCACSVFLLAADVGCKRNSIHACKEIRFPLEHDVFTWGVFDLGAGCWTEEDTLIDRYLGPWFLPTLDSVNLAKAND